jgi:hypothetical protein
MKLKLLKPYGMLAAGDFMDTSNPVAELLIKRKIAEPEQCIGKSRQHRRRNRSV